MSLPVAGGAAQMDKDADAILKKIDDLWRGASSKSLVTMRVKTAHWERTLVMDVYSEGTENSLVKIVKPLKEQGIATLKVGNEIYNYLPKTDRTIKLTAAMMMGSWMGSHFTNDDLVKESRMSEDYNSQITFTGKRDGQDIVEITLIPKPQAAVVWGKIVLDVRDDDQPVKETYYDEDGQVVRILTFDDYRRVSGRVVPMHMKMTPEDKPGEFTEITYETLSFNVRLPAGFFSLRELKR
jgi:outer membrane lipoprotein-sorting protein